MMKIPRERFWGVLLAGGHGERLWPWSRRDYPKQFLTVTGHRSLLQAAYDRLTQLARPGQVLVIGNGANTDLVRQQLPRLPRDRWVGEPFGRNTAAAIGTAAYLIGREDPGAVMVVATADHVISPAAKWIECMRAAAAVALEDVDRLVCIGIRPTEPATGYGYVLPGPGRRRMPGATRWTAPIARFVEKPPRAVAQRLIRQGALWNSGMFVWSLPAIARALQRHLPQLTRALVRTIRAEPGTRAFTAQLTRVYRQVPPISIDYGVMEHAADRWVVPSSFTWDDVGSWTNIWQYLPLDPHGNAVRARHAGVETKNTLILGEQGHLIGTIGVKDLIIVQSRGVTLIAHRSQAQRVRQLVARCQEESRWRQHL